MHCGHQDDEACCPDMNCLTVQQDPQVQTESSLHLARQKWGQAGLQSRKLGRCRRNLVGARLLPQMRAQRRTPQRRVQLEPSQKWFQQWMLPKVGAAAEAPKVKPEAGVNAPKAGAALEAPKVNDEAGAAPTPAEDRRRECVMATFIGSREAKKQSLWEPLPGIIYISGI